MTRPIRITIILILAFMLFPLIGRAQIMTIKFPNKVGNAERQRVLKLLNGFYGTVSDSDLKSTDSPVYENSYRGFFLKAKLLKNKEPLDLFFYFKDGICFACHKSGIAVVDKDDNVLDYMEIWNVSGYVNAKLIEYDNKGTCVIMISVDDVHGGGVVSYRNIIRLNPEGKFETVYSKSLSMKDCFGYEVNIGVTLTAADNSGYKDIVIKEYLLPIPGMKNTRCSDEDPPQTINNTITLSMKKYQFSDSIEEIKHFFRKLFTSHKNQ